MSWKFVFNGSLKWHGDFYKARLIALEAGYKFLFWMGEVYFISQEDDLKDFKDNKVGITTEDLY